MSASDFPFTIFDHATVTLAATVASSNVQLGHLTSQTLPQSVRITAPTANSSAAFIRFGPDNAIAATVANDVPILPGTIETFQISSNDKFLAVIMASGTGTIYATVGLGQ